MLNNSTMSGNVPEVTRAKPNGISIIISGAGIGGLMAALECWRRGFDVRIFEKTKSTQTQGDSFTVGPSALNAFRNWPFLEQRNREILYLPLLSYHDATGKKLKGPIDFAEMLPDNVKGTDVLGRHSRPMFHQMLLDQLHQIGVQVEYGREVIEYFEETTYCAGVVLKDGSRHEADLVIAADGGRGNSWPLVAGEPVPARSSGHALFRVAFPVEKALADPDVAERWPLREGERSVVEMWVGPGVNMGFWRNENEFSCWISHPDTGTAEESWGHRADLEEMVRVAKSVEGFPEVGIKAIRTIPPGMLVDWKLMWRDPQPRWTAPHGLVVQLGDAAHMFLPSSGNGATQAMEDAISLAACLAKAGRKDNIAGATRVHNLLRFERVSCLQAFGVVNQDARDTAKHGVEEKKYEVRFGNWIVGHDPEQYAVDNYEAALAHLTRGTPFNNTNTPPGLVYRPWTIDGLLEARAKGEPTILDADWDN